MKIALGIYRLHPRGGLEDNCIRIAKELAMRGHEVTLFVAGPYPDLPLPVVTLQSNHRPVSNHGRVAAFATAFSKTTAGRFDITVTFQPMPGADILFLADTLRDRPDVSRLTRMTPRFRTFTRLERGCFGPEAKTRIIGLARPQMQAFADRYPDSLERIAIIPPSLARSRRRPELRESLRHQARRKMGLDNKTAWLWLGLQPEVKGLDRVIEVLPHHPHVELVVAGLAASDSKIRRHLARAVRLGVAERVRCIGYVSDDRYFRALAAADVLAHPARVDVTGGVILEAIANGLPVVATDVCGFAEHIDASGAGMVVRGPFKSSTFSKLLDQVGGHSNAELSQRGAAYGARPELYSGIGVACDLIEAFHWKPLQDHDEASRGDLTC
ncbi:glycosyltransferase family 4 protein [Mesorhizobium sp. 1B3]|uniref:glycosyltransferase family 4 protein n=1 Tax=Mesorhizobium sp. 1B3 TaxID=3243599 RepID=UPI003D97870C